jgi:hypothetical protein
MAVQAPGIFLIGSVAVDRKRDLLGRLLEPEVPVPDLLEAVVACVAAESLEAAVRRHQ